MLQGTRTSILRQFRTIAQLSSSPLSALHDTPFSRNLSSLALLEQRDNKLNVSSLAAVSAAQKLGGSVTGFIAGKDAKAIAEEVSKVEGLEKVIFVASEAYDKARLFSTYFCRPKKG